ncbi:MAG: hypothetical protein ACI3ZK_00795 [Candidatus Cryptobacteroides sp.]
MKTIKFLAALALGATLAISCTEKTENGSNYLKVEKDSYDLSWDEHEFQVGVSTDREVINVSITYLTEDSEWLTAQWVYLNDCVNVNVSRNSSLDPRSAEVKLSGKNVTPVTFIINQDPAPELQDPFDDGTEPAFDWDDSWDVYNFTYTNQGNYYKYEPLSYGELGVPKMEWGMVYGTSGKISVGLKLEKEFLEEFGGQQIAEVALWAPMDYTESVSYALVEMTKSPDRDDMPSWQKGNCYSTSNIIWESGNVEPNNNGWFVVSDRSVMDQGGDPEKLVNAVIPTSGDIFLMAYMEGDGSLVPVGDGYYNAMLWIYPQPTNRFAPTYINPWNSEGRDVYLCKAGTCAINFFFTKPE